MKKILLILLILEHVFNLNAQTYSDSISQLRKEHLAELVDTNSHILNSEEIKEFVGLDYFTFTDSFKITAVFVKNKGKKFKMKTSTERAPVYRRYGYVDFILNNQKQRLTVYQNIGLINTEGLEDYLFIPFRDSTCTITTYGGGRYLDFKIPTSTTVTIDFNLAYNPYCAFKEGYSCPIPPVENRLKLRIEAGEKLFGKKTIE